MERLSERWFGLLEYCELCPTWWYHCRYDSVLLQRRISNSMWSRVSRHVLTLLSYPNRYIEMISYGCLSSATARLPPERLRSIVSFLDADMSQFRRCSCDIYNSESRKWYCKWYDWRFFSFNTSKKWYVDLWLKTSWAHILATFRIMIGYLLLSKSCNGIGLKKVQTIFNTIKTIARVLIRHDTVDNCESVLMEKKTSRQFFEFQYYVRCSMWSNMLGSRVVELSDDSRNAVRLS